MCHPEMQVDVSSKTYAQSLRTFVPGEVRKIQDPVGRMHRMRLLASEFFALHIACR